MRLSLILFTVVVLYQQEASLGFRVQVLPSKPLPHVQSSANSASCMRLDATKAPGAICGDSSTFWFATPIDAAKDNSRGVKTEDCVGALKTSALSGSLAPRTSAADFGAKASTATAASPDFGATSSLTTEMMAADSAAVAQTVTLAADEAAAAGRTAAMGTVLRASDRIPFFTTTAAPKKEPEIPPIHFSIAESAMAVTADAIMDSVASSGLGEALAGAASQLAGDTASFMGEIVVDGMAKVGSAVAAATIDVAIETANGSGPIWEACNGLSRAMPKLWSGIERATAAVVDGAAASSHVKASSTTAASSATSRGTPCFATKTAAKKASAFGTGCIAANHAACKKIPFFATTVASKKASAVSFTQAIPFYATTVAANNVLVGDVTLADNIASDASVGVAGATIESGAAWDPWDGLRQALPDWLYSGGPKVLGMEISPAASKSTCNGEIDTTDARQKLPQGVANMIRKDIDIGGVLAEAELALQTAEEASTRTVALGV